jgi:hypothetical protein
VHPGRLKGQQGVGGAPPRGRMGSVFPSKPGGGGQQGRWPEDDEGAPAASELAVAEANRERNLAAHAPDAGARR